MANIEEKVETLIQPIVEKLGYKLYDVQYVKEASNYYLRIFIEKENGVIDLDDCEKVNNGINDILDTADYIKDQYFLEVSSTGLEKVLRKDVHLQNHIGCEIMVNLFKPINLPEKDDKDDKDNKETNEDKDEDKGKKKNKKETQSKELVGILKAFDKESVTLEIKANQTLKIKRKNISVIKTVYHWDDEI